MSLNTKHNNIKEFNKQLNKFKALLQSCNKIRNTTQKGANYEKC